MSEEILVSFITVTITLIMYSGSFYTIKGVNTNTSDAVFVHHNANNISQKSIER